MSIRKRLGKVVFDLSYVVDLDNDSMVEHAKECIYEDIMNALKYNEVYLYLDTTPEDPTLSEKDIPEFLLEEDPLDTP